jgi:hypothetical protein
MADRCVNRFTASCQDEETKCVNLIDNQLRFSTLLSRGCMSYGQVASVAFLVSDLTALCLHYLLFPAAFLVSSVKARWSVSPLSQHPNRCTYRDVSWHSTRHHLPTSVIPTQRPYDVSDTCQCSRYTCSWRGAHPYLQSIRHQLNTLGTEPNTMQQITNVILWSSAIAIKQLNTTVSLKRNRRAFHTVTSLYIKYTHTYVHTYSVEIITVERFVRHVIWLCTRNEHTEWDHRSMSSRRVVVCYMHRGGGFIRVRSQH